MRMNNNRRVILDLLCNPGYMMLRRNASTTPMSLRGVLLTGTCIVELKDGHEKLISEVSGRSASNLINDGYVELAERKPMYGVYYQLSEKGRRVEVPPAPKSITRRRVVEGYALEYGTHLNYHHGRKWFYLSDDNGQEEVIENPVTGGAVERLVDLTHEQWEKAIEMAGRKLQQKGDAIAQTKTTGGSRQPKK